MSGNISGRIEWLVLLLVLLATISIEFKSEDEGIIDVEVTHISAEIIMATDSSMDAIGLGDYDRGGNAYIELNTHQVVSEGCNDCTNNPTGLHMNGTFLLKNVTKNDAGSFRFEGPLTITYLTEYIDDDFIAREWLSINLSAGDVSSRLDLIVVHDPPRWHPVDRSSSAFVTVEEGSESRTGPWIFVEPLLEEAQNVRGCLPDNKFCSEITRPDAIMNLAVQEARVPLAIEHPAIWTLVEESSSTNQTPTKLQNFRDMLNAGEFTSTSSAWCPISTTEITASQSWDVPATSQTEFSPMGLWLNAMSLPSSSIKLSDGVWNEVEHVDSTCGSLIDSNGELRLGIKITD